MGIFQEPYMISLQRILAGNNNSYKISFDKENIFVEYIPNLMQFASVLDDKNFLKKKPKNLIMHYFIAGILGNMDINPTNILINKRNKFYFVD